MNVRDILLEVGRRSSYEVACGSHPEDIAHAITTAITAAAVTLTVIRDLEDKAMSDTTHNQCIDCDHRLPHNERWGCLAEVGDAGSGSVADAVFCGCGEPPRIASTTGGVSA